MACSNILAKAGTPPTALDGRGRASRPTSSTPAGPSTSAAITVRGDVPGATAGVVRATAAEAAKDGCPISRALKGNVELSVEATLEG